MEHMGRIALELNNFLPLAIILRLECLLSKLHLELICLHLKLIEGLLAAFAAKVVIIHKVLNSTDHDRVL